MTLPINVEDRLSFLVRIPCHEGEEGISRALLNGNENENNRVNDPVNGKNDLVNYGNEPVNDTIDDTINTVSDTIKGLSIVQKRIL